MHRYAVGQIQLVYVAVVVHGGALVIEQHRDRALGGVDSRHAAHVAVEHARAAVRAAGPLQVVVVLGVHNLIADPEQHIAGHALVHARALGVERLLQRAVERPYAGFALLGRGQHLYAGKRVHMRKARQAARSQLDYAAGRLSGGLAALYEEVAALFVEHGHLARVDAVRAHHYHALAALAMYLAQPHAGHRAARYYVAQHAARPHGGQLIGVAHQHQPRAVHHRVQQRAHKQYVHHGHLVADERLYLQRMLPVAAEVLLVLAAVLQQAVYRAGLHARGLAHTLGRPPRGRAQRHVLAVRQQAQYALDYRGLARARAAGYHRHAARNGQRDRLALLGRELYAVLLLKAAYAPLQVARVGGCGRARQLAQPVGHVAFGSVHALGVYRRALVGILYHHLMPQRQLAQGVVQQLVRHAQQAARASQQLLLGQVHMARRARGLLQHMDDAALYPVGRFARYANRGGYAVGGGKADAGYVVHQPVGVGAHHRLGGCAVQLVHARRHRRGKAAALQEHERLARAHLFAVAFGYERRALGAYAGYLVQALGLAVQYLQRALAKFLHDDVRRGRAYALYRARGQVALYVGYAGGRYHLAGGYLYLLAVIGMLGPFALYAHALPLAHVQHRAHGGNALPALAQLHDRPAV